MEGGEREGERGGVALVSAEAGGQEEESPPSPLSMTLNSGFRFFHSKREDSFKERRRRRLYDRATKLPPQIINRPGAMKVCRRCHLQMRVACPVLVLGPVVRAVVLNK